MEETTVNWEAVAKRAIGPGGHWEIRGTGRGYRVWVPFSNGGKADSAGAELRAEEA